MIADTHSTMPLEEIEKHFKADQVQANVKFKRIHPDAKLPTRATPKAVGLDLYSVEAISLAPGAFHGISTGFEIELPSGYEGQVRARSGNAIKFGVGVVNSPGTIDEDYRGELKVILINHGPSVFDVKVGDRIGQLVISAANLHPAVEVDSLSEAPTRGQAGFGSTGR